MFQRLICLLTAAFFASAATAQEFPGFYRVAGVAAHDVLNIRAEPSAQTPIVGSFAPNEGWIEVVGLSEDRRWGLVRTNEGVGWSHMRYLQRQQPDSWIRGTTALDCHGTEPFWRMSFFLPTNRAEYVAPDDSFEVRTDAPYLPSTAHPPTLALAFEGARQGFAVIRQGLCSDGMSDMLFGLETQIYWRGNATGLTGCCSLSR
jgi:uncharacterized membrane protein